MKKLIITSAVVALGISLCSAQTILQREPVVSICTLDSSGKLAWTNSFCPNEPVYEVLLGDSVLGPWTHHCFVTNCETATVQTSTRTGNSAFYQIAWTNEAPLEFDYTYCEEFGMPAVTGVLSFSVLSGATVWHFEPAGLMEHSHPTGIGQARGAGCLKKDSLRVPLVGGGCGAFYLEGDLQRSLKDGRSYYSGFSGTVYQVGFAGTEPIGTFTATARAVTGSPAPAE